MNRRLLLLVAAVAALTLALAGFALVTLTGIWQPTSAPPMPRPPLPPTAPSPPQSGPTLRVAADSFGCFTPVAGEPTEVWPGVGVRAFVGGFGRFEPGAADAFVYVRGADGAFEQRRVERMPTAQREEWRPGGGAVGGAAGVHPIRDGFLAAATSWAKSHGVLRPRIAGEMPPAAPPLAPSALVPRSPPPPGAPLAAWAPAGMPFVRFRSTEAAFRFADIADRLAARLAAASGDGRDFGSLRWALHDLTLPAVWSANPEGTRGAGECAVVFDGLPWRGRARLGAVLRIVDADLYRMESEAGVSYAALPEHLWAPADDPHPASRARRNHRRTVADVEAIGTDPALLASLTDPTGDALASDPEFAALDAAHARTDAEAAFLFVPRAARAAADTATNAAAARFTADGVSHLWTAWTGEPLPPDLVPDVAPTGRPPLLAQLVALRVVTDAKGADVEAVFASADAARAAADALAVAAKPFADGAATCARTRAAIAPLAVMDRPQKDLAERAFVVFGWKPVCPCGGTYVVHPVTRGVSCTAHGTDAKPLADPPAPPRLVRNVAVGSAAEAATLRFRVPIDWNR